MPDKAIEIGQLGEVDDKAQLEAEEDDEAQIEVEKNEEDEDQYDTDDSDSDHLPCESDMDDSSDSLTFLRAVTARNERTVRVVHRG